MNTITEQYDGVNLIRPEGAFEWPHPTFSGFPACCGPGANGGFLEKVMPESILGLGVGPACWIHDWMQGHGPKTWQAFHHSNAVFLNNLLEINRVRGGWRPVRIMRVPVIVAWYEGVTSTAGVMNYFGPTPQTEVQYADL